MLHIPLNQHLLPFLTPLGHLSVQTESLNGIAKTQKSSRMNRAGGFCKGNGEEWRHHCWGGLNSATPSAHPHSSSTVLLQKGGKTQFPCPCSWLPAHRQYPLCKIMSLHLALLSCLEIIISVTSIQSHSYQVEQCPAVRI